MKVRFGDVLYIKGRIGWQALKKSEYLINGDYYLITGVDINENSRINFQSCYYVSKERYELDENIQVVNGDIIVTKDGTIGKVGLVENMDKPATLNSHLFLIRNKRNDILDTKFLFYILKSDSFQSYAKNNTSGSNIPAFTQKNIENYEIELPSIDKQIKIAHSLDYINNKILNNNKIISELESMSKTIYDYWFNQFEFPNEEGKPYKSSGGKMVWNDELKREIPEGWEVVNIMENHLCNDIKAGVDIFDSEKNYLPTANINLEQITEGENVTYDNRESRANMQPRKLSVWFAKMKNSIKHISIPKNSDWFIEKYILSTGFQGLECNEETFSYIHCFINQDWFEVYKDVLSHGATQESVNNEDLKNIKFAEPKNQILNKFNEKVYLLLERKFMLFKENQELTKLRDFLLPLLMNGQAKIEDYEQI